MWVQNYRPIADSLAASAAGAALPLIVIGVALAVWRMASWKASVLALTTGLAVAIIVYGMPTRLAIAAAGYGAAFGLFPLGFIVYAAILLFDIVVASGRFETIRESLVGVSPDQRIQALLIAFAFGAFLEGAAGAGTPVAVSASLLVGIGFTPLRASAISLLANTAPVAFGALGLPVVTLAAVTGLPLGALSAAVGRICPLVGMLIPFYLIGVVAGGRAARETWPASLACGVTFAVTQFFVSNFIGPYLADIISAIVSMIALVVLARTSRGQTKIANATSTGSRAVIEAWLPYLLLVGIVILWGAGPTQRLLDQSTRRIPVPSLHLLVQRMPPVVSTPSPYPAIFVFNWLGAAGTACLIAAVLAALITRTSGRDFVRIAGKTARSLAFAELTIALVVGLAFVMNYAGATATLGLATAQSGRLFPFFSAYLGWLGVFLTGSDTSGNALFGPLQVISASRLHLNPVLMAAVNTCGGVMGKMVSIQSIAVAAAATGMKGSDEGTVFRLTLRHSMVLAAIIGLIALVYAYALPGLMPAI
jgi:lactate permease